MGDGYFIYRYIRNDTNMPFYVGDKNFLIDGYYYRTLNFYDEYKLLNK